MKISIYTFLFLNKNQFYIYNTLSNALVEIDKISYDFLKVAKHEKRNIAENEIDSELFHILIDKYFLTENDSDEFIEYKKHTFSRRNSDDWLTMTIAPTMDCNYSCHYCFETRKDVYITTDTIQAIVNFVKWQKPPNVRLIWFGGEPLLAIDQMNRLYEQLKTIESKNISSGIITNGYYLNEKNIRNLKSLHIDSVQITLDGLKDTHNKIKDNGKDDDSFSTTIQNIDLLVKIAPEIQVNIRINTDKNNADEFAPLHHYLSNRYRHVTKFTIAPGIVQDFEDHTLTPDSCQLFSRREVMEFGLRTFKENNILTTLTKYPGSALRECSVRNKNTIAFDPEGFTYKCWEIIGKKEFAIGKLNNDGEIVEVNHQLLNRYLYGADPLDSSSCQKCAYLPVCEGGCPHHRIMNEFYGKHMDTCIYYKGYIPDLMKIHLESKEK